MIAVIADTHMPKGERRLPSRCAELIAEADAVIHAGDFIGLASLREIEALNGRLHAVHGNVDEPAVCELLPATATVSVDGHTVAIVHDGGPASGRLRRLRERFPLAAAVVFGHSHMPLHERDGEFQIFNPGSPTERRRAPRRSMGLLHLDGRGLKFEHVWLELE